MSHCKVRARANIALSKYWGKADVALNLPAGAIEAQGHFHLRVAAPDLGREL